MAKTQILIWVFLLFSKSVLSQPTEFTYEGFKDNNQYLSLNGNAEIEKDGILRLTNDTTSEIQELKRWVSLLFSTCFAFAIQSVVPKLGGHGFAFTISPNKNLSSALPSQYLGLLNSSDNGNFSNHIFAVEFDTIQDFEFGDINDNHMGIDMNSLVSNSSVSAAYYAENSTLVDLYMKSGQTILAWIEYDSFSQLLNVTISPSSSKPRSPILSYKVDLSPILYNRMYVGFSASTGLLASSHYIFGWSFNMSGEAKSLDLSSLPSLPGPPKKNTVLIIGVFVSSLVLIISICAIAFYTIRKIRNADVIEDWEFKIGPHRFSYKELKKATKGFRDKELIGFGGFGKVYKGTLPNSNSHVAVKRISHESTQGLREFISEISSIGRLRHRNLVQLLGWCRRRGKPTTCSDVFAFGALLLEVKQKALPEELILVDWVWDKWKEGAILQVVDPRLNGEFDEFEAIIVLKLGLICSNNTPQMRPTMRQVVRYLDGEISLPEVMAPLEACDKNKSGDGGNEFEDFKVNTLTSVGDGDDNEAGLVSLSPLSPSKGHGMRLFFGPFEAIDGESHKKL
ncbi:Legume lectin domain [Dillenia turbinata]|uniref:Legume lectin domain n=1 Tax=Dillenia turbinata TaxID=194707 RepID=A0AAN8VK24_9MAGN